MRKAVIAAGVALMAAGCGRMKISDEMRVGDAPRNLAVVVGNRMMTVSWEQHREGLISGYNIYVTREPSIRPSQRPVAAEQLQPFNRIPYPGDTNPDDGIVHYVAEGLENGVKYYVSVRVLYPDGTLSMPSDEIPAVCGPRGKIQLSLRFQSDQDGYSFQRDGYVRADATENDLYFYRQDGVDYLASPSRLGGFLRTTNFSTLPFKGELQEIKSRIAGLGQLLSGDRVVIRSGDWVLLRTPENRYALINVLGFSGDGAERTVRLFFAYSTLAGERLF